MEQASDTVKKHRHHRYLKLTMKSVALAVFYVILAYTTPVQDWYDARYVDNNALLLKDFASAMLTVGLFSGLYIAAQIFLVSRHTADLPKKRRLLLATIFVVLAMALSVGMTRMANYEVRSQVEKQVEITGRRN